MKILLSTALFLVCGSALAANVTLQFEEETPGSTDSRIWEESSMHVFSYYYEGSGDGYFRSQQDAVGASSAALGSSGNSFDAGSHTITITSEDTVFGLRDFQLIDGTYGSAFDLISMDFCGQIQWFGTYSTGCDVAIGQTSYDVDGGAIPLPIDRPISIVGVKADGSFVTSGWSAITGTNTLIFDSEWNDLVVVRISGKTIYPFGHNSIPGSLYVEVDNVVVNVVPIPAAVWLFASALAGLGWLRRKRTI